MASGVSSRELVKEEQSPSYVRQMVNGTGKGVKNAVKSFSPWEWASRFKAVWQILRGTADDSIPSQPFRPVELTAEVVTTLVLHYFVALGIFKAGTKFRESMAGSSSPASSPPPSSNIPVSELPQPPNIPKPEMPAVSLPPMPDREIAATAMYPELTEALKKVTGFASLDFKKVSKLSTHEMTALTKAMHLIKNHAPTFEMRNTADTALKQFNTARHAGNVRIWEKYTDERLKGSLITLGNQLKDHAYSLALESFNTVKTAALKAAQETFNIALENYSAATGALQETYTAATGAAQEAYTAAAGAAQEAYTAAAGAAQEAATAAAGAAQEVADQILFEYLRRVATIFSISVTGLTLIGRRLNFAGNGRRMVDAPPSEVEPDAVPLDPPSEPLVLSRSERRSNVAIHKMLELRGYFRTTAQRDESRLNAQELNHEEYQTKYCDLFYYVP